LGPLCAIVVPVLEVAMNWLKLPFIILITISLVVSLDVSAKSSNKSKRETAASKSSRKKRRNKKASKRVEGEYVIEKRGGKTVKYKKKATYDFEGVDIEGIVKKPSGSYISNIKDVKGRSIIRIRKNFDAEVLDTARMLK